MRKLLQPIRFFTVLASILVYLATVAVVWVCVRRRWAAVRACSKVLQVYSRWGLFLLNVDVRLLRKTPPLKGLYVGNHLSYLDVLVIASQQPACFVTSVEIKETPGLGLICQMSGCLFVERRNKTNLRKEVSDLTNGLLHDLSVAIFPEATSTNGEQILRFRRPLFMGAIDAGKPVIPFCLNYRQVGGQPIDKVTRDKVFWYGDMDFIPHLWALSGSGGVKVDLQMLEPIFSEPVTEPGSLAELSQQKVQEVFAPV